MTVSPGGGSDAPRDDLADAARRVLGARLPELRRVRPSVYWLDWMASAALGWALLLLSAGPSTTGPSWLVLTLGAVLAQLRALVFVHEIAHRRAPPGFERAWNALVGIPMAVPGSLYVGTHLEHHRTDRFAGARDPEYAPLAGWGRLRRAAFVGAGAVVPPLLVLRWGLLGPLSRMPGPGRRLRPFVVARASTLAINPAWSRDVAAYASDRSALRLESACAGFVWTVAAGVWLGVVPLSLVLQWHLVAGGVFATNQLRTLGAHGYDRFGSRLDREGQFLDSINLTASPLAWLIAPLGLRYHATHHLLPELPYHSLGRAHRLLLRRLAADSLYRRTPARRLRHAVARRGGYRSRSTSSKSVTASSPRATGVAPISAATSTCSKQ